MADTENIREVEESGNELDAFIEFIKSHIDPNAEPSPKILNPHTIEALQFATAAIKKVLRDSGCESFVKCAQNELNPRMGYIDVEAYEIDINDMEWFSRVAEFAANTEVYPLADGRVRMTFTFYGLLKDLT